MGTAATASAAGASAPTGFAAHTRAPIHLAATATGTATCPAAAPAAPRTGARAGARRAVAGAGLAARARGRTVDTGRRTGQQLGGADE